MLLLLWTVSPLALAEVPNSPDEAEHDRLPTEHPAPATSLRQTRLSLSVGRAFTGKIYDQNAFADAELHGGNFVTLSAVFGCNDACLGFVLPLEGVNATSTELATGGVTELSATTITPSVRLAYTVSPVQAMGLGATAYFDLGYQIGVTGNVDIQGLAIGLSGDLEYWFPPGIAVLAGIGLSGSPYSVLHYPTARLGVEYGF